MSPIPQSGASLNLKDITRAKIEPVVPDPENQQHKSAKSNFDSGTLGWGGEQKFDLTARQKILCGAGAGAFCRVITNPFDLVKIRFQVILLLNNYITIFSFKYLNINLGKLDFCPEAVQINFSLLKWLTIFDLFNKNKNLMVFYTRSVKGNPDSYMSRQIERTKEIEKVKKLPD